MRWHQQLDFHNVKVRHSHKGWGLFCISPCTTNVFAGGERKNCPIGKHVLLYDKFNRLYSLATWAVSPERGEPQGKTAVWKGDI